jgi:hypothetical protein
MQRIGPKKRGSWHEKNQVFNVDLCCPHPYNVKRTQKIKAVFKSYDFYEISGEVKKSGFE